MSKFLAQSKSLLPMVVQKSTTDMIKPAFDTSASFVAKQPIVKGESKPETPSVVLNDVQQNVKDLLQGNLHNIQAPSCKIPGTAQRVRNAQKNPTSQKTSPAKQVVTESVCEIRSNEMISSNPRTLFSALKLDLAFMQERLAEWFALGHMWLYRRQSGLLRTLQVRDSSQQGPRDGLVWLESRTRMKEEEPVPVILPDKLKRKPTQTVKTDQIKDDAGKKECKGKEPFKSNFLETVQKNAPEWQVAISNRLGALQKTVVRKLSDGKK